MKLKTDLSYARAELQSKKELLNLAEKSLKAVQVIYDRHLNEYLRDHKSSFVVTIIFIIVRIIDSLLFRKNKNNKAKFHSY